MTDPVVMLGLIDHIGDLAETADKVMKTSVLSLMCTCLVAATWMKSNGRAGPTVVSVIVAAAIWWGVMNMSVLRDSAGEDISPKAGSVPAVVLERGAPRDVGGEPT